MNYFGLVTDRLLGDCLEDGAFSEMDVAILDRETVNLHKTNVCSERDFALLDWSVNNMARLS